MTEQARCLRRHPPPRRVFNHAPRVDALAQVVDDRHGVVLLLCRRNADTLIKDHRLLADGSLAFARLGHRRNKLRTTAALDDLLGRLPLAVQFPVASGIGIG